jgi:hypothetical protein
MDIFVLLDYLNVVVCGISICVGFIIKNLVPSEKVNKYIPLIMGALGILLTMWIVKDITPSVVLTGLISGLASTGLYEAFRNMIESLGKRGE